MFWLFFLYFFFFKQKGAYECRISDWGSDVCSSDLRCGSIHGGEGEKMRKVRDYDAELRALNDKAKALNARKVQQLGELVTSTGADALDLDTLAGALLAAVEAADANEKEAWRSRGAAFFQGRGRKAGRRTGRSEEQTSELQSLMRISYA